MIHESLNFKVGQIWHTPPQLGDIGAELEIEGLQLPKNVSGWAIHAEHSLRGDGGRLVAQGEDLIDTPREYVTNGAYALHQLTDRLNHLHAVLTRAGTAVKLTPRASTHFHVNMQGETLRAAFGFMLVYCIVEPVLLRLCGPQRNGNLFCIPCYETGDLPDFVRNCETALSRSSFQYWPQDGGSGVRGKYSALNTDPLTRYGSIELRCFPNSYDPKQITEWASWCISIRDTASSWTAEDYGNLFDTALENPRAFCNRIFGSETTGTLWSVCAPQNLGDLISAGVETSYEVWLALLPFLRWTPGKTKKKAVQKLSSWSDMDPPMEFQASLDGEEE